MTGRSVSRSGPERIPLTLLAQEQRPKMTDRIGPVRTPAHPRALQATADDRLARRFHAPRPDLPAQALIPGIVHPMHVVLEVLHQLAMVIDRLGRLTRQIQALHGRQDRRAPLVLHLMAPLLAQIPARRSVRPAITLGQVADVLGGVPEVED